MGNEVQIAKHIEILRTQGVFFLPGSAVTDEMHLTAFLTPLSRRVVVDSLIFPTGKEGVACVPLGKGTFLLRIDALAEFIAEHEQSQHRGKSEQAEQPCDEKTPCAKSE